MAYKENKSKELEHIKKVLADKDKDLVNRDIINNEKKWNIKKNESTIIMKKALECQNIAIEKLEKLMEKQELLMEKQSILIESKKRLEEEDIDHKEVEYANKELIDIHIEYEKIFNEYNELRKEVKENSDEAERLYNQSTDINAYLVNMDVKDYKALLDRAMNK